jgi:predicted nucleic acid-binding protein
MSYLVDTNIMSETSRANPNSQVLAWFDNVASHKLFISVLSIGELRQGVEKLAASKRKNDLIIWLEGALPKWFGSNILPITREIAEKWGYLNAMSKLSLPAIDGLLAATALTHNLKLITRNTKDFLIPGLEVINPFLP